MEPGTYVASAMRATLCETKNGREQVAIEFETEDGGKITAFLFFGDKVDKGGKTLTERTVMALRDCGWWHTDDLSDLSSVNGSSQVEIVVQEEEFEGKTRSKVRFINSLDGGFRPKAMDAKKAQRFAEKMKTDVSRAAPKQEPPPAKGKAPASNTPDAAEDDIPF